MSNQANAILDKAPDKVEKADNVNSTQHESEAGLPSKRPSAEEAHSSETGAGLVGASSQTSKKRRVAPAETCPFCGHIYTVRDGLSGKTDCSGKRLHLRKCQCREKTPPCRNCPKCKELPDIMRINEPAAQFEACQLRFQCEICACKCPGLGKWVETDPDSRGAYAHRTTVRAGQAKAAQQQAQQQAQQVRVVPAAPVTAAVPATGGVQWFLMPNGGGAAGASWSSTPLLHASLPVRLSNPPIMPATTTATSVTATTTTAAATTGAPALAGVAAQGAASTAPPIPLGSLTVNTSGPSSTVVDILHCSKCIAEHANHKSAHTHSTTATPANKPLPESVASLVKDIVEQAAGTQAAAAVTSFLQAQCVTGLEDLQYIELSWMQDALVSQGVPMMLLNKLLKSAASGRG